MLEAAARINVNNVAKHTRRILYGGDVPQYRSQIAQRGVHDGRQAGLHFTADIRLSCTRP